MRRSHLRWPADVLTCSIIASAVNSAPPTFRDTILLVLRDGWGANASTQEDESTTKERAICRMFIVIDSWLRIGFMILWNVDTVPRDGKILLNDLTDRFGSHAE